jgi:hypothetical protein
MPFVCVSARVAPASKRIKAKDGRQEAEKLAEEFLYDYLDHVSIARE